MEDKLLMGAKHFIDMPKGTMYIRFWENDEEKLKEIIEHFKDNTLKIDYRELEIYGNNYGSMSIYKENILSNNLEDYISYYDANVVGDANPSLTLYLIINENLLPDYIEFDNADFETKSKLTKKEILKIRQIFLNYFDKETEPIDNKKDKANEWAREQLADYKNNYIINFILNEKENKND